MRAIVSNTARSAALLCIAAAFASADAHDEVIALVGSFVICKAAFDKALFVYPTDHLEMRQGARIILKSKEDRVG